MTLGVSTAKIRAGVTPRSSLTVGHDYLRMRLHANGGSNGLVAYERGTSGVVSTGTFTLGGTTTSSWATAGVLDPSGDNTILINDQTLDGLCRLDTLTSGGLLLLATINAGANQATTSKMAQYGSNTSVAPGGWYWNIKTTPSSQFAVTGSGGGTSVGSEKAYTAGERTLCGFIDVYGGTLYSAVDGDFGAAQPEDISALRDAGELAGTTESAFGASFICGHSSGVNPNGKMNETSGALTLRDFWLVRFETDLLASVGAIFTEYHAQSREMLRTLT